MQQVIGVTNQDWGKGGSNAAFFVGLSRDPVVLVGCAAIPGTATGFECRNSGPYFVPQVSLGTCH